MDEVIDTIKIEVDGDSEKALGAIDRLIERLDKIQNAATGANKPLGALGRVMKKLDGIFSGSENMSKLRDLADGLSALGSVGKISISKTVADRIMDIGAAVDCLKDVDMTKLSDMASGLAALGNVGDIRMPNISAAANRAAGGGAPSALSGFSGNGVAAPEQTEATNSELTTTLTLVQKIKQGAAGTLGVVKQISDKIGSGIKKKLSGIVTMFTRRVVYRAMNALISLIVNGFRTGIAEVYQYSKAIDGRLAKSLDTIATAMGYLHASLGAAAAPIINMLAPAVDKLTDGFVNVLNIVNQVLARLSGADTWTRAIKTSQEYAEATDDAAKANKKLKNSILGFDEINALNGANASGAGNGTSGASYRFEEVPIDTEQTDKLIDKLRRLLTIALGVGAAVKGWKIADALNVPELGKAADFMRGLSLSLAGAVTEGASIADIIANGMSGTNLVGTLLGGGAVVGGAAKIGGVFGSAALGAGVGAIIAGIPMAAAGIWDAIKNKLNWLNASLIATGTTLTGAGIGAIIGACGGPIGAGIGALIGLVAGALTDLTILVIQNWDEISAFLSGIGAWIWDNIFVPVGGFFSGVAGWINSNVIQPVVGFFSSIFEAIGVVLARIYEKAKEIVVGIVKGIASIYVKAWEIFVKLGEICAALWKAVYTYIVVPVTDFFSGLAQRFYRGVIVPITQFFSGVGAWVYGHIIQPFWNWLVWLKDKAVALFKSIGVIVIDFASGLFKKVINGIFERIESTVNGFIKMLNGAIGLINKIPGVSIEKVTELAIPRLASGGFPDEGQLFIAREAGPEMVGTMGSRTAVANNAQIVEGIRQGVYEAMLASGRGEGDVVIQIVDADGTVRSERHISAAERRNRRDGRVVIPLGT